MGIFSSIAGLFGYHPELDALNQAKDTVSQGYDAASAKYTPYTTAGSNGLTQFLNATGQGNSTQGVTDFQNSPIYKMLMTSLGIGDQGVLANSAGSLDSGNTVRALSDYNRNQTNNAFGSYLNPIAQTANQGYDATGQVANLGVQKAGSVANIQNQIGQVTGANSIWGGLDSGLSQIAQIAGGLSGGGGGFLSGGGGSNPLSMLASKLGLGGGGGGRSVYAGSNALY